MSELTVQVKGITKKFPGVIANDNIDFALKSGSIHGLLGENGAGKTVLMSILYGLYQPDSGRIFINDTEVEIQSPAVAIELGIGMVHQHFMLVDNLTVTENIILGREPSKAKIFIDTQKAARKIGELSKQYGLPVDPEAKVQHLSVGEQQRVEILKMLYREADILILDEPTSVLSQKEIEALFSALKTFKKQGKSIVFITHKLREALEICDEITVLRRGKVVGNVEADETNESQLTEMMVGSEFGIRNSECRFRILDFGIKQEIVLEVDGLKALDDRGLPALNGVSLEVKSHEILGIAGVQGNGQTELVQTLTGLRKPIAGEIRLNGRDIAGLSAREMIKAKIAHIPDRLSRGLIFDFTLEENAILGVHRNPPFANSPYPPLRKGGFVQNRRAITAYTKRLIKKFGIRTSDSKTIVSGLSGGNQQRMILARELSKKPKIIVAFQPTVGLDVAGIEYVHEQLVKMKNKGCAVLLISMDLDEIIMLSDRIAVMYGGEIVAIKESETTTKAELGSLMLGGYLRPT
ncbi:TPA: ABC transporter ATP-binding protein [Candidatus Poribacteria bacterium]|nr:ABC transporter ATP-binding protein [Candidatus Poribacteria bacterium]